MGTPTKNINLPETGKFDEASRRLRDDLELLLSQPILEADTKFALEDAVQAIDEYLAVRSSI